ncbi:hypothetical protein [Caballeronia telluris]|uniref:hypothetical protein n=1 Tax=Caballeronia telluris TaxID=326475 RepID=UPI000A4F4DCC|nr:hypothetical protein [Caballeronia telluris]
MTITWGTLLELLLDGGIEITTRRQLLRLLLCVDDDGGLTTRGGAGTGSDSAGSGGELHLGHPHGAGAQQQFGGYGGNGG